MLVSAESRSRHTSTPSQMHQYAFGWLHTNRLPDRRSTGQGERAKVADLPEDVKMILLGIVALGDDPA